MGARINGTLTCDQSQIDDDIRIDGALFDGNLSFRRTRMGELATEGMRFVEVGRLPGPSPSRVRVRSMAAST